MASMIKPCDICGDPGVAEAIIICSECQVAREHLYCMREFRTQAPPWWRCEECQSQSQITSPKTTDDEPETKNVSTFPQQTTFATERRNKNRIASKYGFKEKWVDKGRTKYLSCDEAVKLSSGSMKVNNSRNEFRSAHGMSKSVTPPRVFQRSTGLKEKATLPTCERVHIKSPKEERNIKPKLQQHVVQQSISPKDKATPLTYERVHIKSPREERIVKQSVSPREKAAVPFQNRGNAMQPVKSPRVEGTDLEKEPKTSCKNHADVEAGRSCAAKPNLTSGLPVSEMHDPYIPALNSYWKGCFYLPNGTQTFNEAFTAHPPSRVHYKVYETVKKMPERIYFQRVSYHDLRMDIFPADRDDIGLYFFPMFKKRGENDISIIDCMWRNNLVMKSNVEGAELFVLSSRVLPSHAQEYQGNNFLWGVFRGPKTAVKVAHSPPSTVVKREACYDDVPPGFTRICRS
ncbi:putative chromatin regulator PHD family [Helianthus annuus]|nr:putative chromatin regulator PHD family [Helianthus annuus]